MASAIEELTANRMMTTTSMITVTPNTSLVKGPVARSSLTTAIAEDGERATSTEPASRATAS
jgi:hypothetical protein